MSNFTTFHLNKGNASFAYSANEQNIDDIAIMENNPSHQSYVDYGYCDAPTPRRKGLDNAAYDGEYLYETQKPSNNRRITFAKQDATYYDTDPDYYEPDSEYIEENHPIPPAQFPNHSSKSTRNSKPSRPVQQDVYDEDGYTLAREDSHPDNEKKVEKDDSNKNLSCSNKKIGLLCCGLLFCCIVGGVIIGVSTFELGKYNFTKVSIN